MDKQIDGNTITTKVAEALYTINKAAKELRDRIITLNQIRYKIKNHLFRSNDEGFSDEELLVLKDEFGIEKTDLSLDVAGITVPFDYDCSSIHDLIEEFNSMSDDTIKNLQGCYMYLTGDNFYDSLLEHRIDTEDIYLITYDMDEDTIRSLVSDEESVKNILEEQEYIKSFLLWLETIEQRQDKLHQFLHDSKAILQKLRDQKRLLYTLKSVVLTISGVEPTAYHVDKGGEVLAYFIWGGFKFHMPIDPADIIDKKFPIDNTKVIDIIASENRLENPPSLEDAVSTLLSHVGLFNISAEDYLSEKYDIEDMLGIYTYEPARDTRDSDTDDHENYEDFEYEYEYEYDYAEDDLACY